MSSKKVLVISGKRKTAIARVVIKSGKGNISINRTALEVFEPKISREKIMEPLNKAGEGIWKKLDMKITVAGGGYMGQAEAVRMAIAKALLKWTKSSHLRTLFIEYDRTMVAGDSRRKEPKKFGGSGARARGQKSYR
jgi:small subunit ribosomal protein S9